MSISARKQKGFTLVELLVVITIIAILSIIGLAIFTGIQKGARDAKRKGDLHAIRLALEQYKAQNGQYPVPGTGDAWQDSTAGSNWQILNSTLSPNFIQSLPTDPLSTNNGQCNVVPGSDICHVYHYCTNAGGVAFWLGVNLETGPASPAGGGCESMSGTRIYIIRNQQ